MNVRRTHDKIITSVTLSLIETQMFLCHIIGYCRYLKISQAHRHFETMVAIRLAARLCYLYI